MTYTLPSLNYAFEALEPHIDALTMQIHHGKHHAAYIAKLNAAVEGKSELAGKSVEDLIMNLSAIPEAIRNVVRNNGGGHANHTFFWKILAPNTGGKPSGELASAIDAKFGSFENFQAAFETEAVNRFGSGWAWLAYSKDGLELLSLPNQDSPLMDGKKPVFGVDVWEHAYYLNYQNRRPDYLKAIWNVIDWNQVAMNFSDAVK